MLYVPTAAECDAATGGWHYDVDPASGATPAKIVACPTSCAKFQATKDASIDIALGCSTRLK